MLGICWYECVSLFVAMPRLCERLQQSVKEEVFREYCANSSIHGVRYFDRNERTVCERCVCSLGGIVSLSSHEA